MIFYISGISTEYEYFNHFLFMRIVCLQSSRSERRQKLEVSSENLTYNAVVIMPLPVHYGLWSLIEALVLFRENSQEYSVRFCIRVRFGILHRLPDCCCEIRNSSISYFRTAILITSSV